MDIEFKEGDEVWFFFTVTGRRCWDEATIVFPGGINLERGKIVRINPEEDFIHVYVDGEMDIVKFGFNFFTEYFYRTKEDAAKAMNKAVNVLLEELS